MLAGDGEEYVVGRGWGGVSCWQELVIVGTTCSVLPNVYNPGKNHFLFSVLV